MVEYGLVQLVDVGGSERLKAMIQIFVAVQFASGVQVAVARRKYVVNLRDPGVDQRHRTHAARLVCQENSMHN